ncbi:putative glucose transporter rco-3 [Beauveria bassiana]|uniref:Putative glucose transporter rco-3 n=1 Tax=Beauveria bassiana TaxID=176275 RepID=A0A2N6NV01_BEABA|nr:putative glucose transporter rco-3 [Beauveria bassiana]
MAIAMRWQKPDNVAGSSAPAIMVGLFVASGGLLFGYDTGAINGILAMDEFKKQFSTNCSDAGVNTNLCPKDSSIIVAILSAGTVLGALIAAPFGDFLGRRKSLLLGVALFCIGAICQVCAEDIPLLLVGRFLAGVGVGAVSVLVPMYQSEMAPKWIRGTLIVPALIITAGLLILPETPRFLVKKGRNEEAGISLSRLRRLDITHPALIEELHEIIANHQYELTLGDASWKEIFVGTPHLARRTFTGCGLQMLQQLSGINFIMYFSTTFFGGAGIDSPYTKSLIIQIINVISTIPGLIVIESWGRRRLLMAGAIGMAACQLIIASFFTAAGKDLRTAQQTILMVFCSLNIFFFASSWGPVVWVVTSEIYPLKIRAKAMSISTASNWLLNFGIAYSIPFMVDVGPGNAGFGPKIFFIWGAFCVIAVLFVWCMVYETSKISLEQIDEMYERVNHAWESKRFEPSWSFQQIVDEGWSPSAIPPPGHELHTTPSQTSAETTLNDSGSTTTTHETGHSTDEDKAVAPPTMANVDFSY